MLPLLGQDAGARVVWSCTHVLMWASLYYCVFGRIQSRSPWTLVSDLASCAPTSAFGMLTDLTHAMPDAHRDRLRRHGLARVCVSCTYQCVDWTRETERPCAVHDECTRAARGLYTKIKLWRHGEKVGDGHSDECLFGRGCRPELLTLVVFSP